MSKSNERIKDNKVSKLIEVCQDLDENKKGYISTKLLATILRGGGISGIRTELKAKDNDELSRTFKWLEQNGGSSIKGKVNYRHFFNHMNMLDTSKPDDHQERERMERIKKQNKAFEHRIKHKTPEQMRKELMQSKAEVYQNHPNDSELEHFYQKSFFEYPQYEYRGINEGGYQVKKEDERLVFGSKYLRLGADPASLKASSTVILTHPN